MSSLTRSTAAHQARADTAAIKVGYPCGAFEEVGDL